MQSLAIKQWGRFSVGSSAKQISFPIAFPSALLTASRWQSNKSEDTNIRVNESTTTYLVVYNHGGTPTAQGYIALGNQQWGLQSIPAQETILVFPLSYSTLFAAVACGGSGNGVWSYMNIDNNTVSVGVRGTTGYETDIVSFIALCMQQWGFSTNPVTYPIAFNEKTLLVCGLTFDLQSTHSPNVYQNLTTKTGFPWERYSGTGTYKVSYIAFGYQQWGYVEDTSARTISLQIALAKNLYCVVADESISASSLIKTTTSFTIYTSGAAWGRYAPQKFHWVAIVFQQWGYATRSGTGDTTFNFPISFSTIYCVNAGRYFSSRDSSNSGFGVISQSTTKCVTYTGASQTKAMTILAIGIQQWGNSSSNTFPVSFTNTDWKMAGLMTSSRYDYTSAVISKSQNGFQNGSWGNPYDYIVIGMQQWGKVSSGVNKYTQNFPIAFSSTSYSCAVACGVVGENDTDGYQNLTGVTGFTTTSISFSIRSSHTTFWLAIGK